MPELVPPSRRPLVSLGWACFLAASWTWCIGMYLPVLLVRDFGAMGWVVFAVPNVLGAAAMAWVLARPRLSGELVEAHRPAMIAFSLLTIAYQAFFMGWVSILMEPWWLAGACVAVVLALRLGRGGDRRVLPVCAAVIALSVAIAAWVMWHQPPGGGHLPAGGRLMDSPLGALWLLPVCIFGFALCPYLDLTFHVARQSAPDAAAARWRFGVGFGVFFLAMILFTLLYAPQLRVLMAGDDVRHLPAGVPADFLNVLGIHLVVQAGFTIILHLRALQRVVASAGRLLVGLLLCVLVPLLIARQLGAVETGLAYDGRELGYRLLLAFYGLLLPGYVWLCMWPRRGGRPDMAPSRRQWTTLIVAALAAAPMYALGFLADRPAWLAGGVAVMLAARLTLPANARPAARHNRDEVQALP